MRTPLPALSAIAVALGLAGMPLRAAAQTCPPACVVDAECADCGGTCVAGTCEVPTTTTTSTTETTTSTSVVGGGDLTGDWSVTFIAGAVECSWAVVETAGSLSMSGPCALVGAVTVTGVIDPGTRVLDAQGPVGSPGSCTLVMSGAASSDGNTMSGSWVCGSFNGAFTGSRQSTTTTETSTTTSSTSTSTSTSSTLEPCPGTCVVDADCLACGGICSAGVCVVTTTTTSTSTSTSSTTGFSTSTSSSTTTSTNGSSPTTTSSTSSSTLNSTTSTSVSSTTTTTVPSGPIDFDGIWDITFTLRGGTSPLGGCVWQVTQTGGAVTIAGPCDYAGQFNLAGTFDPDTGQFDITGSSQFYCNTMVMSGTVSAAGTATATFDCASTYFGTFAFTRRPPAPPACGNRVIEPEEDCDDGNAEACDGCTDCHLDRCGDSLVCVGAGEQCDDGNASAGDGCDPQCQIEPVTVTGTLGASGTLTTDTGGAGATPSQPVQAAVTTPTGGDVTIALSGGTAAIPGFSLLTGLVQITAPPAASAAAPLTLAFLIDASLVPSGETPNTIQVTKDGVIVPECTGAPGEAVPDPCVSERLLLAAGDVQIVVLTTSASAWGVATSVCSPVPAKGCRKALKAPLLIKKGKIDAITWKWRGGFTTLADFGDPVGQTDYTLCAYDQHGSLLDRRLAMVTSHGGTCSGSPCWRQTSAGFQYKATTLSPDGRLRWKLQTSRRGPASIAVTGRGAALGLPPLPFDQSPAVIMQLRSGVGTCWEADYSTHVTNTSSKFKAQAD